ncbi:MAG TPA: hypothetical protein VFO06_12245 [Gemmatimonadales bacterium]|nr:hypothetical protein [Gemmatimonadales bacterium]
MNSRWNSRVAAAILAAFLGASGCGDGDKPAPGAPPPAPRGAAAQADADRLGREVFDLLDRAASYAATHQRRYPPSLREAGVDSLTPAVARVLETEGPPVAIVMFRRPIGKVLTSCRAPIDILEESALNDGQFTITCTDSTGQGHPYTVRRPAGH